MALTLVININSHPQFKFVVISDNTTQQNILPEHPQVEGTVQCQSIGIVNEICQTAYNLNVDHNQHMKPKDYMQQTIRWV